jgi:CO dehydrogenase maturation factor
MSMFGTLDEIKMSTGRCGFKLAVSGKGGVGKSTVASAFARLAAAEGKRVIAIDADPAASLAACLGMGEEERRRIVPLSKRRALIEERTGAKAGGYGAIFKLNPEVSDIAEKESARFQGIHLLVLGAIEGGGTGCACPESAMLRALLADVILHKDDCAVIDFEAGLEHLGRATARGVDVLLVVVEPGSQAVETGLTIRRLAGEIGVPRVAFLGNKAASPEDEEFLRRGLAGADLIGILPHHEAVLRADREGKALVDVAPPDLLDRLRAAWESVQRIVAGG